MSWQRMLALLIVLVVICAWGFILLKPAQRPDLMNSLAGCYRGGGSLSDVELAISRDGLLNAQGQILNVSIRQDKIGISFLPDRLITYDPGIPSKLVIGSGNPLLLRISSDRQSVTIPGDVPDIVFKKVACPANT